MKDDDFDETKRAKSSSSPKEADADELKAGCGADGARVVDEREAAADSVDVEPENAAEENGKVLEAASADEGDEETAGDDDEEEEESVDVLGGSQEFPQDDPLDEAYDLDVGAPIDRAPFQPAQLPWRSAIKSAKEFFNSELLYRFDVLEPEQHKALTGSYRVELKGYQGGIWSMHAGEELEVVNRREDADVVITMQQRDFLQLVNGRLNPQLAILGQKMRVQGDVRKALVFQELLCPINE